jgi:hypothetical protein
MDVSHFYETAAKAANEAVTMDKNGKFDEAAAAYETAVEHIISGVKCE